MIYFTLFFEFFKIGLFCFGGAFGMIPLIKDTVLAHGWLTESEFYSFIGVCESTPGPIAVNMATYIGSVQGGVPGSIAATLGVVLPSFFIILLIAELLRGLTESKYFKGFLRGVQPVVTALILSTGVILLLKALGWVAAFEFQADAVSAVIFVLLAGAYYTVYKFARTKLSAIELILLSAALGIVLCTVREYV